ncbi:hypothetical protein PCK1_000446 [Pneumocystis canis]|nr:hypothetical protein PCK1_000446 [Pneumocystis canis]
MTCTSMHITDTLVTHTLIPTSTKTEISTVTSKLTITSTKECRPTPCTTDRIHSTQGPGRGGVVVIIPSEGRRVNGWGMENSVLKKRDQAGKGVDVEAEHLLALILKEEGLEKSQCKQKLGKYCEDLKNANLTSKDIHDKLTDYCKEEGKAEDGKCDGLKAKVEAKCTALKEALDKALKTELGKQPFTETVCEKHEHECLFLEGADPDNLKDKCSKLRTKCYERKRQKVRDKVLMRALKGELKEGGNEDCEKALKGHCVKLGPMSTDLMQACLSVDNGTCQQLVNLAQTTCVPLKKDVDDALKKLEQNDKFDKQTCLPLLEECYFYSPNCKEDDKEKPECEKLKKQCEEKDVEYMPPEGPFIPIDPTVTVLERVGLDMLYKEAAKEGVLIERLSELTTDNLIFFLGQNNDGNFDVDECKTKVAKDCNYLKTLTGEKNNDKCEDKCTNLNGKLTNKHDSLKESIKKNYFFGNNKDDADSKLLGWHEMQPDIITDDCEELESQCFYWDRYDKKLKEACQNVRAMCYKRGLNDVAYEELESQMRGYFDYSGNIDDWSKECQKNLTKICDKVKHQSVELLSLCIQPKETCVLLQRDIQDKTYQLTKPLTFLRDSPKKEECIELGTRCNLLQ